MDYDKVTDLDTQELTIVRKKNQTNPPPSTSIEGVPN